MTTDTDDSAGADYHTTAMEFISAPQTEKRQILEDFVANEPNNCSQVDDGFVISASAAATEVAPETPLEDVIADICGPA